MRCLKFYLRQVLVLFLSLLNIIKQNYQAKLIQKNIPTLCIAIKMNDLTQKYGIFILIKGLASVGFVCDMWAVVIEFIIIFNMLTQSSQKYLVDPYRTIGNFVTAKISISHTQPYAFTAPTNTSFKVYSQNLSIKVASPPFPHPITEALSHNEYTYLRTLGEVIKMKYHHMVGRWMVQGGQQKCKMLKFDNLIILSQADKLVLIDEKTNEVTISEFQKPYLGMIHPVTYVNKLVLYSGQQLTLVNAISNKILYEYPKLIQYMKVNELTIATVESTPLVDIVAIGFLGGIISFLNLKKDEIVFSFKQKNTPTVIGFSTHQSLMASGDHEGNVILWDLQNKRIVYKCQNLIRGLIDTLIFLPGLPILTCASSQGNCIKQLRINFQDNKILSLYRQRVGNLQAIEKVLINNNNDLVLSTATESMFISFYSQCNNYILPKTLDSKLPFHLVAKHFNVELYSQKTLVKTFKIHEYAMFGKISLSNKYYIIATKRRMVKLGASYETQWTISNVSDILLYNEHFIYAFTPNQIVVCDFNTSTIVNRFSIQASKPVCNLFTNLLAFNNVELKRIEIWDMQKMTQGRIFDVQSFEQVLCLSFTSDNHFLISTHKGGKLLIWNIIDNQLYKEYILKDCSDIIWHCFTPDNQFMISINEGRKQANVWNNYIGKINSTRIQQEIVFKPKIRQLEEDYRNQFTKIKQEEVLQQLQSTDILDTIPDACDQIARYDFQDITKWIPLVYYDQIKARNTPDFKGQAPSMPFFLDFQNLTQEKKKIEEEIRKEAVDKKKSFNQQKDKHLRNQNFMIQLNEQSSPEQYKTTFQTLSQLSIAQIDYQLRSFLLNPENKAHLMTMITKEYDDSQLNIKQQYKNIILHRILNILGGDLVDAQLTQLCKELLVKLDLSVISLKEIVDRCIAIIDKKTS